MTERILPGPEAQARIEALDQKDLQKFFDEVPIAAMQRVARILPSIKGFRQLSPVGIARQKEALARRLSRSEANDRDYHGLYFIWREWIDANLRNATLVQELVGHLEVASGSAEDPDARRLIIEEHVDSFLEKLKEESQQNKCTREQIDRLFTFSPFPETPAARGIIAAAKSAAQVERDATLTDLPSRLRQDEDEIKSIKSHLKALAERADPIAGEVAALKAELPKLQSAVGSAKAAAEGARANAERARAAVSDASAGNGTRLAALEQKAGALGEAVEELRADLRGALSKLPDIAALQESVAQAINAGRGAAAGSDLQLQHVQQIATELEKVKRDVLELLDDRTGANQFTPLAERLAELERCVETIGTRSPLRYETKGHASVVEEAPPDTRAGLRSDPLTVSKPATAIQSHADLVAILAKPLESLGLRKSAALLFAEECAAAVAARHVVFLQGGLATRVARALAQAVGGSGCVRVCVPIGLQNGDDLRLTIEGAIAAAGTSISAIAVEGINRTALDVTQEVLADCANPPAHAGARAIVFATVLRGIASLPVDAAYFELGPVFDLDYLDWRSSPSTDLVFASGSLSAHVDDAIHVRAISTEANVDECVRLMRCFARKRNPSIERVAVAAYRALHMTRSDQKTITPLQSLFFGWLLPRWRVLELPKDQVETELDGGKVNSAAADPRLVAMLHAEFPEAAGGNGQS